MATPRYAVFAWSDSGPAGGWGDKVDVCAERETAETLAFQTYSLEGVIWFQVVDLFTCEIVLDPVVLADSLRLGNERADKGAGDG